MTSSTRSICVTISCRDCPVVMIAFAGDMNELRNPWKAMTIPIEKDPRRTRRTPVPITSRLETDVTRVGMLLRNAFSCVNFTSCVLTLA